MESCIIKDRPWHQELEAAAHITSSVGKQRGGSCCCCCSAPILHIHSPGPCPGNGAAHCGRVFTPHCHQEIPHRHAQRPISLVTLESAKLTSNAYPNHHNFTSCQQDTHVCDLTHVHTSECRHTCAYGLYIWTSSLTCLQCPCTYAHKETYTYVLTCMHPDTGMQRVLTHSNSKGALVHSAQGIA